MTYESPSIKEIGRFSSVTLGEPRPVEFDDNTWYFFYGSPKGSR